MYNNEVFNLGKQVQTKPSVEVLDIPGTDNFLQSIDNNNNADLIPDQLTSLSASTPLAANDITSVRLSVLFIHSSKYSFVSF